MTKKTSTSKNERSANKKNTNFMIFLSNRHFFVILGYVVKKAFLIILYKYLRMRKKFFTPENEKYEECLCQKIL